MKQMALVIKSNNLNVFYLRLKNPSVKHCGCNQIVRVKKRCKLYNNHKFTMQKFCTYLKSLEKKTFLVYLGTDESSKHGLIRAIEIIKTRL